MDADFADFIDDALGTIREHERERAKPSVGGLQASGSVFRTPIYNMSPPAKPEPRTRRFRGPEATAVLREIFAARRARRLASIEVDGKRRGVVEWKVSDRTGELVVTVTLTIESPRARE